MSADPDLRALVGHRFPGGSRAVPHWENWLLTDCTRRAPMRDGLLHPIVLFHVPIQAVGTSIGELFELGGGDGTPGSVTLLGYDWEYLAALYEDVEYRADGGITEVVRRCGADGATLFDDLSFAIELTDAGGRLGARATNRWRFRRAEAPHEAVPPTVGGGAPIPSLVVDDVGVDRMKTMAALLRDPYPIHWDPDAARAAGHEGRPVNQGPLNVGYIANMLMAWAGDDGIRRLSVDFHGRVLAGDTVTAAGTVEETPPPDATTGTRCAVWLDRTGTRVVSGFALV